ncbi:hypothetical protein [Streptomyces sp. NPDC020742]|uniref:hypothetical protein n=1 Tax=Streptomyces sp. NPDC020742 TaxID=3154897 RepID=UPI0033D2A0E9
MFAAAAALTTAGTAHGGTAIPRVVDVTPASQIPTVDSHLKGAVPHQVYRVTKTNADRDECLDRDTDTIPANEAKLQLWACSGWTIQNGTFH